MVNQFLYTFSSTSNATSPMSAASPPLGGRRSGPALTQPPREGLTRHTAPLPKPCAAGSRLLQRALLRACAPAPRAGARPGWLEELSAQTRRRNVVACCSTCGQLLLSAGMDARGRQPQQVCGRAAWALGQTRQEDGPRHPRHSVRARAAYADASPRHCARVGGKGGRARTRHNRQTLRAARVALLRRPLTRPSRTARSFEMPFNVWCGGCRHMIAKGAFFHARLHGPRGGLGCVAHAAFRGCQACASTRRSARWASTFRPRSGRSP